MIVVADTGPLNYLVLIEAVDVLQPLYTHVVVPKTVAEELRRAGAPSAVQTWIAQPPVWFEVRSDPPPDPGLRFLDPGESAAQSLAELLRADGILIDERDGRTEAAGTCT
jgi:predicted nucleic acid-binding protein